MFVRIIISILLYFGVDKFMHLRRIFECVIKISEGLTFNIIKLFITYIAIYKDKGKLMK